MSSDLVVDCLKTLDVEAAFLPPAILEDMSQDSTCIQSLKQLKFVIFGGGKFQSQEQIKSHDQVC